MNTASTKGKRFDDLTRRLATGTSWRTALRDLAATTLAGPIALFSTNSAFATQHGSLHAAGDSPDRHCRPILAHCHDFTQCCSGLCLDILKICL